MPKYKSIIQLGKMYRDPRTGIVGYANRVVFHASGCTEVLLEFPRSGRVQDPEGPINIELGATDTKTFPEQRLEWADDEPAPSKKTTYTSDVVLDELYETSRDNDEMPQGRVDYVIFQEYQATRVGYTINSTTISGSWKPETWEIDEYLIKRVGGKKVKKQEGQTGSIMTPAQQVAQRVSRELVR